MRSLVHVKSVVRSSGTRSSPCTVTCPHPTCGQQQAPKGIQSLGIYFTSFNLTHQTDKFPTVVCVQVDDSEHKLVSVADTLANTCHCKRQCSARCPCQVSPLGCSVRCHDPEFKCRKRRRDDEEVAVLMLSSLAETGARDDTATLRASSQLSNPKRAKRTRP